MEGRRTASPERRGGSGDRRKKAVWGLKNKNQKEKTTIERIFSFPDSQRIDDETENVAHSALPADVSSYCTVESALTLAVAFRLCDSNFRNVSTVGLTVANHAHCSLSVLIDSNQPLSEGYTR